MTTSQFLNIFGLVLNLDGLILLFLFGVRFRIRTGGEIVRLEHLYDVLGGLGAVCIVCGTALQIWVTVR